MIELRHFVIQLSGIRQVGGAYRANKEVSVVAPDVVTAIRAAEAEVSDWTEVFVNSATHRGLVHLIVEESK